jgi:VWFA-related protein
MAALRCSLVYHCISVLMGVLHCCFALAQSPEQGPQSSVKLNVLVTDKSNRPAMDLNQANFLVLDEGKQQTLSFFQKEDIPISYGLIVDNTGSMRPRLTDIIQVAKAIVDSNGPEDQAFILRLIDGKAQLAASWTSDKTALLNSLSVMNNARGMMPLIDSIYACSEEVAKRLGAESIANRRRAIILLTDGLERGSSKKMDELLSRLHKDSIQVFAVSITSIGARSSDAFQRDVLRRAAEFLKTITEETGGRSLYPETEKEMKASAELIASYLRSQYVIGYDPGQAAKKDALRKVRVIIDGLNRDKYSITSRKRYSQSSNR